MEGGLRECRTPVDETAWSDDGLECPTPEVRRENRRWIERVRRPERIDDGLKGCRPPVLEAA